MPPLNWRAPRGVYALKHIPTGKVYIGSTINLPNRWKRWKAELTFNQQELPRSFPQTTLDDWEFKVVKEYPPETEASDMQVDEHQLIARFRALHPELSLNSRKMEERETFIHEGRETTIYDLSRETGIQYMTLLYRYNQGWRGDRLVKPTTRMRHLA